MIKKILWNIACLPLKTVGLLRWLMKKIDAFLAWVGTMRERNACRAQMLGGMFVILMGIILSFYPIPLPKLLSMVVTLFFAVCGTWILRGGVDQWRIIHAPDSKEKKIQDLEQKVEKQQSQINLQQQQLSQTQNRLLNVDSIKRVLSLNVLELKTNLKDFRIREVEVIKNPGGVLTSPTTVTKEHLSFIDKEVCVNIGIDIESILVCDDGERILVSRPNSKCTGVTKIEDVREHSEFRETVNDDKNNKVISKTISKDNGHHQFAQEHNKELNDKIFKGADITGLEGVSKGVERIGMEFIERVLSPIGKPIIFVSEDIGNKDIGNMLPLVEFVENYRDNVIKKKHLPSA